MLAPETRVLLSDALRPPTGQRVELAVATTYSLDLTALLLAPMTFALHDDDVSDLDALDPVKLLEAVRRHAEHTTVFVQAGAIAVPSKYRRILTFAEDCVHEVTAPEENRLFHPKVWVLRFAGPGGAVSHRLVCLSRNLTFDRSWDTVLVLDEHDGEEPAATISTAPLIRFLGALPGLTTRSMSQGRADQLASLQASLAGISLAAPSGVTEGSLLPLGFAWSEPFPVPKAKRSALISPFLDVTTTKRLIASVGQPLLLSRPETLDRLGAPALTGAGCFVLQRAAEREVGADLDEPATVVHEGAAPEGLHAKTFIFENGRTTTLVTGSANATGAGVSGNVEFDVVLEGPTSVLGVDAFWIGSKEAPGFGRLCQPYAPPAEGLGATDDEATTWDIERYHAQLAQGGPVADVEKAGDSSLALRLVLPDLPSPGRTTVRPVTLHEAGWTRDTADPTSLEWRSLTVGAVTPLFVVTTTAGTGSARTTVAAVLTSELHGDPEHRRRDALADVLKSQADVLRYLAFLLGDAALLGLAPGDGASSWLFGDGASGNRHDVVLFEPLVRALAEGSAALERVASLHQELAQLPDAEDLLPDGWSDLWAAVWAAHRREVSP